MGRNGENMANRNIFGTSFSMKDSFNLSTDLITMKGKKDAALKKINDELVVLPFKITSFIPGLLGALPVVANPGAISLSLIEQSALGAMAVAGRIAVNQTNSGFNADYLPSMMKVTDGSDPKKGSLKAGDLKKLVQSLMSKMLQGAGPARTVYSQLLRQAMEDSVLQTVLKGDQPNCKTGGDPVNLNTGNFLYEKEDLLISGKTPLSFHRFYNRMDVREGCMGAGWRHNYEIELLEEDYSYTIIWQDGREEVYQKVENNVPEALFGNLCRLKSTNMGLCYEAQDGIHYIFNKKGRLISQKDSNGIRLSFYYDKLNRLERVCSRSGSSLSYYFQSSDGRLIKVTDHNGRNVSLTYELGRLKMVTNAMGSSYAYTYDENKSISAIKNPRHVSVLENKYDHRGRTISQHFADGGSIRYDYQDDENRVVMTDQNGHRTAYFHDNYYRNIKTIYENGQERFSYNEKNQMIRRLDKNGNKVKLSYDNRGNISQIIYPDGSKRNTTYDAQNRILVLSVNGIERRRNIYDTKGNLIRSQDALGRIRECTYDENGNAVTVKQPDGSILSLKYDSNGNITHITDEFRNTVSFDYDSCNRIISKTDGNKNRTSFTYDNDNRITCVINAAGKKKSYEYTKNGKVCRITDFNGAVTRLDYDCMNMIKSLTFPDGGITYLEYDLKQNITKRTTPNGAVTIYEYNSSNCLERMTLPTGGTVKYEYDPNGNKTAEIDPVGNKVLFEYDDRNRKTAVNKAGARTEFDYDMDGNLTKITNAMGKAYLFTYDKAGQKTSETDIIGNTVKYEYNELGELSCITDPKGRRTVYEYYPGGLLKRQLFPNGSCESYFYDSNKNLICRKNKKGDYLEYTYNCLDQLTAIKSSFGQEVKYTYDESGNIISVKDALGRVTAYEYSIVGKLTGVTDAAVNKTEYAYDSVGNLITICQHEGKDTLLNKTGICQTINQVNTDNKIHVTHYTRDAMGKIVELIDPLGGKEYYSYNQAGQLVKKKDKEGFETQYSYTPMGDVKQIQYMDGRSATFTYNSLKKLTEIKDWLGITKIERDEAGRPVKISDYKGEEVGYQWGITGEKTALLYPDGRKVKYQYDKFSRLSRLIDGEDEVSYNYNEDGFLSEKIFPNGISCIYSYNNMGRLSSLMYQAGEQILEKYDYNYDLMGNKTEIKRKRRISSDQENIFQEVNRQIMESNGIYKYQYDSLNHLIEVIKDRNKLRSYEYDAFGNRVKKQEVRSVIDYRYNAMNQLLEAKGAEETENFQYDKRGNVIQILKAGKTVNTYFYDETNRMTEAWNLRGDSAKYVYNGTGNRVEKIETVGGNTKTSRFILDLAKESHNLLQLIGEGVHSFVWDSSVISSSSSQEETRYYLSDEMNSPVQILSKEKQLVGVYGYDEFGNNCFSITKPEQPFGYTGYQMDNISNTYFAQYREYQPDKGRFAATDLIHGYIDNPKTLNRYDYCFGNPVNFTDANGKFPVPLVGGKYMESQEDRRTNCHEDDFDLIYNSITGEDLYSEVSDIAVGLPFKTYDEEVTGEYTLPLIVNHNRDSSIYDESQFFNKSKITDPQQELKAYLSDYTEEQSYDPAALGCFYITKCQSTE